MIPFRRLTGMCAALVALVALGAATSPRDLDERKADALRTVLETGRGAAKEAQVLEAAARANALTAIRHHHDGSGAIAIELSAAPAMEAILIDNGRKLVLDFEDTVLLGGALSGVTEKHPFLVDVRTSQYRLNPLVARVVLEFAAPIHYTEETQADGAALFAITPRGNQADATVAPFQLRVSHPVHKALAQIGELEAQLGQIRKTANSIAAPARTADPLAEQRINDMAAELERLKLAANTAAAQREIDRIAFELKAVSAPSIELFRSVIAVDAAQEGDELPIPADSFEDEMPIDDAVEPVDAEEDDPFAEEEVSVFPPEISDDEIGFGDDDELPTPPGPRVVQTPETIEANEAIHSRRVALETPAVSAGADMLTPARAADVAPPAAPKAYTGDPLERRVNLDFRQMDLANVVALLGHMAGINIIAGTDITGTVTANFKDVPLRQAMQTVLRINGLGMVEEENIYRIVPYDEAVSANRVSTMVTLSNAKAREVGKVLTDILRGARDQRQFNIAANDTANIVVISGPEGRVDELVAMAHQLDIAEPVLPTVTEPIKLNYAEPKDVMETVQKMLTPQIGQIGADERSRHIVVTDVPVVVEQVRTLIRQIDLPVKQVAIDAMVVDVSLQDEASTGVDWLMSAVRRQSRRSESLGGTNVGNLQELGLGSNLGLGPAAAGLLSFNVLTSDLDWRGIIQAEVRNFNGELVSNPVLVTVENKPAKIEIVREIPYVELTQTSQGGSQTSTEFKIVGTVLEVTPRVTHDNNIIVDMLVKESDVSGEFNGIPIEDKREIETTLRLENGQTIFTGGLRKNGKGTTVRKIPVLGDVPVVNLLFRNTVKDDRINELLIFMTCRVVEANEGLTPHLQNKLEGGQDFELKTGTFNELVHETIHPAKFNDPVWKFRRAD